MSHTHVTAWIKGRLTDIDPVTHSHPGSDNADDHVHGGDPSEWAFGPGDPAYKPAAPSAADEASAAAEKDRRIAQLEADLDAALKSQPALPSPAAPVPPLSDAEAGGAPDPSHGPLPPA